MKNGSVDTRNLISIVNETPTRLKVNFRNGESFDLDITIPEESNATFTITDSSGKNIPLTYDNGLELYTPNDPRFNMLTLESKRYAMDTGIHDAFTLCDTPNQISFTFVYDNNEWKYYTPYGKLIKLKEVEHFGIKNYEHIANRRGYIC